MPDPSPLEGLGIYVHFPWCLAKCPYCDFLSVAMPKRASGEAPSASEARQVLPHEAYADAVIREFETRLTHLSPRPPALRSVFFGGGTPSLWQPAALGRVLSHLLRAFGPQPSDVEVTVECNPTSLDYDHARALLDQGVNRVSIGVQNLDDERLRFLGRLHDGKGGLHAVREALRAGMPRVSADLIHGIYKQDPKAALSDIDAVLDVGVTHLSAYVLTIEPGTRFGALAKEGKLPLLDDSVVARSFVAVSEHVRARGFEHYEVSNFARPGEESVHNQGYWHGRDYLGLGTGAYGTVTTKGGRLRYKNLLVPERYLEAWSGAEEVAAPFDTHLSDREVITPDVAHQEALLLGLRTADGVDLDDVARLRGGEPWTKERSRAVERLVAAGRLDKTGGRLRIPKEQWLFADGIVVDLL